MDKCLCVSRGIARLYDSKPVDLGLRRDDGIEFEFAFLPGEDRNDE